MSDKANPVPEAPQTPQPEVVVRKKTFAKKLVIGLIGLVVLLLLLVLSIPTLLSTNAGKNYILGFANAGIAGRIEADGISLAWFSGQSVTGLRVLDPDGKTVVSIARIDMPSVRLLKLTDLSNDLGTITIDQPKIDIVKQGDSTNLQAAIAPKAGSGGGSGPSGASKPSSSATKVVGPRGVIDIKGMAVTAKGFAAETVALNVQSLTVDAKDLGNLGLKLAGDASYGKDTGLFGADLAVQGAVSAAGNVEPQNARAVGTVDARKLPLAAVDALIGTNGALVALLGPELSIQLQTNLSQESGTASIAVTTQNLQVNVPLVKQGNTIQMDKAGAKVSLNILKAPANEQMARRDVPVTLERDIRLELIVTSLALPITPAATPDAGPSIDHKKLRMDASLTASDILLDIKSNNIGKFEWKGTRADISIPEELDKQATVTLRGGSPTTGGVNALATVKHLSQNPTFTLNADIDNVPVDVVDTLTKQEGKLVALLGSKLELIRLKGERDPDGKGGVRLVIKSANLNGEVAAIIAPNAITLDDKSAPNKLSLVLHPTAAAKLQGEPAAVTLKQPLTLDLIIKRLSLPMADNAPVVDKLAAAIDLTLGDITAEISGKPPINWAKTTVGIQTPALAESLSVTATGGSTSTGNLTARADITQPMLDARTITAAGELTQFPVSLADAFAAQEGKLVTMLGSTIRSAKFQAALAPGKPIAAGLDMISDQASARINATVDTDAGAAALSGGDYLTLRLTPAAVEKFMPADKTKAQRFELTEPVDVRVDIASLKVGWSKPKLQQASAGNTTGNTKTVSDAAAGGDPGMSLDPARTSMDLAVTTSGGAVKMTRTGELLKLGQGKTTIVSKDPSKEIQVKSATALQAVGSASKIPAGEFQVEHLALKNLKYEGFAPVLKDFDVDARLSGKNLPMELVDTYMNKQGEYVKLLGSDLDVTAGVSNFHLDGTSVPEMTGPLDLNIVTRLAGKQVATFFSKGDLKNGILKYTEDGPITFNVTPEFSRQFLEKVSPLIQAVGGQKPISATPTKGFEVPVSGFDIKKVIGRIDLDLGTLNLQKGGLLSRVIGLVGKFDGNIQKMVDTDYAVNFEPTALNLKGGKLEYRDMSMKMGPVSMTYDANVDLAGSTLEPGTRVNIKGETFAGIKAIAPYIKPQDTIRVSLSGPITSPKIDLADAGKQLAEIAAKGKIGEVIDSKLGPGVGGLLDALGGKKEQAPEQEKKEGQEQLKEQPKEEKADPLGGLLNTGLNILDRKTQPKQNPPATQPEKK